MPRTRFEIGRDSACPIGVHSRRWQRDRSRPLTRSIAKSYVTRNLYVNLRSPVESCSPGDRAVSTTAHDQTIDRRGAAAALEYGDQRGTQTMSRRNFLGLAAGAGAGAAWPPAAAPAPSSSSGGGGGARRRAPATGTSPASPARASARRHGRAVQQGQPEHQDQRRRPSRTTPTRRRSRRRSAPARRPTIIWGWGGGGLKSYVDAGQVEDLTAWFGQNAAVKDRLFPSSFGAATVDGKIYAMPCETVQPIVLYYNKKVFDKVGVQPPQSWGDIMDLVPKFNAKRHRAVLARRPVPLDQHDVAGVPASTASAAPRSSRPSSTARRTPGPTRPRIEAADQDPGPGQGQRLHQGLLLDHRRLQRRPGAALHRQGRDDAARRLDVRQHDRPTAATSSPAATSAT